MVQLLVVEGLNILSTKAFVNYFAKYCNNSNVDTYVYNYNHIKKLPDDAVCIVCIDSFMLCWRVILESYYPGLLASAIIISKGDSKHNYLSKTTYNIMSSCNLNGKKICFVSMPFYDFKSNK